VSPREEPRDGFGSFLELFDSNPERAAAQYLKLREKLAVRFEQNGCLDAENLAAEAMERGRRRWAGGAQIQEHIGAYVWGIASKMIHEDRRARGRLTPLAGVVQLIGASVDPRRRILLEQCLGKIDPEAALLVREYHLDRKRLAARLGINANALRIRYCRIMKRIRGLATHKTEESEPVK
jgi:hypothetical protein